MKKHNGVMNFKKSYAGVKSHIRKIIVSGEFYAKLEKEHPVVMDIILYNLNSMQNDITGDVCLALTFNEERQRPRYIKLRFVELNEQEIKLYQYYDINSDEYLDMLLSKNTLKTSRRYS